MAIQSQIMSLFFSNDPEKWGFEVTLGDLTKFVEDARNSGADPSDPIFPELDGDTEIRGLSIRVS